MKKLKSPKRSCSPKREARVARRAARVARALRQSEARIRKLSERIVLRETRRARRQLARWKRKGFVAVPGPAAPTDLVLSNRTLRARRKTLRQRAAKIRAIDAVLARLRRARASKVLSGPTVEGGGAFHNPSPKQ